MGKFIRRLFIILVILTIAFLVYRYINPDGASRLVDKVKAIPDNISGGSSQDVELNIIGTTLVISGDINLSVETGDIQNDEDDMSWLAELNQEIESILGIEDEEELTGDIVEEDENLDFLGEDLEASIIETGSVEGPTGDVQEDIEVPPEPVENEDPVDQDDSQNVLTDVDYQQIEDIFGNLVE